MKYHNKKIDIDGITFMSKKEGMRYQELKLMLKGKVITELSLQPTFMLQKGFTDKQGNKHREITYIADFVYQENGKTIVEDTKGMKTEVYKIKKKLFIFKYPNFIFKEL